MTNRLYLRIDGVLNSEERVCEYREAVSARWWGGYDIQGEKIELLNNAHRVLPFDITLLPSWRLSVWSVKRQRQLFGDIGLAPHVQDMAPGGVSDKDAAVAAHIMKQRSLGQVLNPVILDTDASKYSLDLRPTVVEISRVHGLRQRDIKRILALFREGARVE